MNNFTHYIPTKIYFGKNQIEHLSELADYGKKVLIVGYSKGEGVVIDIYKRAVDILKRAGVEPFDLEDVAPNPKIESVRKGVEICKNNNIDMVLAIGGGSCIDCAKNIAAGAKYDGDAWDLIVDTKKIKSALPEPGSADSFCMPVGSATRPARPIHRFRQPAHRPVQVLLLRPPLHCRSKHRHSATAWPIPGTMPVPYPPSTMSAHRP